MRNKTRSSREKRFWDTYSKRYDRDFQQKYQQLVNINIKELTYSDNVLDCGCGTGLISFPAAEHCKYLIGTDISEEMINSAKKKRDANRFKNIKFMVADAYKLPFKRNEFDVVISCNMLHIPR